MPGSGDVVIVVVSSGGVLTSRGAVVDWWWYCAPELLLLVSMLLSCCCGRRIQHDAPAFFDQDLFYSTASHWRATEGDHWCRRRHCAGRRCCCCIWRSFRCRPKEQPSSNSANFVKCLAAVSMPCTQR